MFRSPPPSAKSNSGSLSSRRGSLSSRRGGSLSSRRGTSFITSPTPSLSLTGLSLTSTPAHQQPTVSAGASEPIKLDLEALAKKFLDQDPYIKFTLSDIDRALEELATEVSGQDDVFRSAASLTASLIPMVHALDEEHINNKFKIAAEKTDLFKYGVCINDDSVAMQEVTSYQDTVATRLSGLEYLNNTAVAGRDTTMQLINLYSNRAKFIDTLMKEFLRRQNNFTSHMYHLKRENEPNTKKAEGFLGGITESSRLIEEFRPLWVNYSKQLEKWGCLEGLELTDIHGVLENEFGISCVSDVFSKSKVYIMGVWRVLLFYGVLETLFFTRDWPKKAGTQFNQFNLAINTQVYARFCLYVGYDLADIMKHPHEQSMNVVEAWEATKATPFPRPTDDDTLLPNLRDTSHLSPSAAATREGLLRTRSQDEKDKKTELLIAVKIIIGMINEGFDFDDKVKDSVRNLVNKKMNGNAKYEWANDERVWLGEH